MITDKEQEDTTDKWHYLALKSIPTENGYKKPTQSISRLFRGITSNPNGDFHCLGCLHSFRTDNKLRKQERLCNNHDFCETIMPFCEPIMPSKDKNILWYNSREKSLKVANAIYFDLETPIKSQ